MAELHGTGAPSSNGHRRRGSLERLRAELPVAAMSATGALAVRLQELTGRDVIDIESLQEIVALGYRAAEVRSAHRGGRYEVDDFGFDPEFTNAVLPVFRLLYKRYWRVETTGIEVVPRSGGALLVSNHAGVLPFDGAMIEVAVHDHVDRFARALIANWFGGLPMLSWFLRRTGQTLGHPDDSLRLLKRGELVLVFPEGVRGTGKPFSERYRLRRFGRGGFVQVALRSGVPIIPISVVGSEEIYPMIGDAGVIARLVGMPYFAITPTWPWLGPLGLVPLPSKWRIQFHDMVRTDDIGAEAADDPAEVMRISDQVRDTIQAGLVSGLAERRGIFRG
ncbi:MAG: acyltransferase family protein [Candidatus Dormibacteraeota bacterium]|nr:acyltransferase family protein [Candidatus Dormibacteraeota bacterium]MBV8446161.1 acyltransferase family protein [Candidatus Dormibacteraeota bacterium]